MNRRQRLMCDELARLRRWKAEALEVLGQWQTAWHAAGQPGRLGESISLATAREIERLRFENAAWRDGVADVVEPLGFDREAACGPADLLPGLLTLAERARSGSHAPDPVTPREAAENLGLDDTVWVRSTGRGTHDVMAASSPVPIVLASVMFTEGVKGRTLALERFAAALGSVVQDDVVR